MGKEKQLSYVLGGDNPDALRGPNPRGVAFDEWDDHNPIVWSAIVQPIMTANPHAWTIFAGTYKGRRDLFQKFHYATKEMEEKGQDSHWYASVLKASESGIIAKEDLEEARKTTTESFFKQEYECEPLENASAVFRNIETCMKVVDPKSGVLVSWLGLGDPNPSHKFQIGVDLAKFNDFTVITPFDLSNFRVYKQVRFNQVDWPLQKAKIELAFLQHSKGAQKAIGYMDSTGLGDPIYDDLKSKNVNIEPFNFNKASRENLLNNLAILLEAGTIKIPEDENLLNELRSFQYVLKSSKGGKARIAMEVPDGVHDDCVMSLALAVWNIPDEPVRPANEVMERKKDLSQFDSRRKAVGGSGSAYLRKQGF